MNRSMTPLHPSSPTYLGMIVILNHLASLIQASAMYCGPSTHVPSTGLPSLVPTTDAKTHALH